MGMVLMGLGLVCSIGSLICWIMTVIAMFQDKEKGGVVHGIIGIICGIWALIWGWMNAERLNRKKVMMYWTILLVGSMVLQFAGTMLAAGEAGV